MKRQILVPLDGSALAEDVLPRAATLARATSSGLMLLRVVPTAASLGVALTPSAALWELWEEEPRLAGDYLAGIAATLQADGLQAQIKVIEGDPATSILECASQEASIVMIAMSTHGRSGLGRWVFGSVADKVLRAAPVPLLLVRSAEGERDGPPQVHAPHHYHTILVPLDGSRFAEQALRQAQSLASASRVSSGVRLVLVSVVPIPNAWQMADDTAFSLWAEAAEQEVTGRLTSYLQEKEQQVRSESHVVQTQLLHGQPAEEILRAANDARADLIVMSTHGRGGLQRLWLGSVAMKVVQGANVPVLLVRAKEQYGPEEQPVAQSSAARSDSEPALVALW